MRVRVQTLASKRAERLHTCCTPDKLMGAATAVLYTLSDELQKQRETKVHALLLLTAVFVSKYIPTIQGIRRDYSRREIPTLVSGPGTGGNYRHILVVPLKNAFSLPTEKISPTCTPPNEDHEILVVLGPLNKYRYEYTLLKPKNYRHIISCYRQTVAVTATRHCYRLQGW